LLRRLAGPVGGGKSGNAARLALIWLEKSVP
jgi:hypothetical protein